MSLAFFLSPQTARAAVPCDDPLVQVAYEADTLPEDDPVAPWIANVTGDVLAFVEGGILTIVAQANGSVVYDRGEERMASSDAYAFSARVWLEQTQPDASRAGILIGGKDGIKSPRIILFDWPDYGRRFVRLETLSWPAPEVELDWSEPHAYRLEVERGGLVRVYVDGGLIIEHPYADLTDCTPGEESFGLSQFGMAESIVHWDWVRYEFCTSPEEPSNKPPVAEAGDNQSASVGQWVTLDGTASHDPDGDSLSYRWSQIAGPQAVLDDRGAATPSFVVSAAVDLATLTFALVVSDGTLESAADTVTILVHASSLDETLAGLLAETQSADLSGSLRRRIIRLLQDAISADTCAEKLELISRAMAMLQGPGNTNPQGNQDLLAGLQAMSNALGPCTRSCREDGGIEGVNLSLGGSVADATSGPASTGGWPLPEPGAFAPAAIDGELGSVWVAPGWGHELIVDLGAKQKVTGFRIVSQQPQTFAIEAWDDLGMGWVVLAEQASAAKDVVLDTCDTTTRFVRWIHQSTEGGADSVLAELEIYGPSTERPRQEWPGSDPALGHDLGEAAGTAWVGQASDGAGWLSTGPAIRLAPGPWWVEYWVHTDAEVESETLVGQAVVVREVDGRAIIVSQQDLSAANLSGSIPIELGFQAESAGRYSFVVYTAGAAALTLERLVLKDHAGQFMTAPLGFLVGGNGRRIGVDDPNHVLDGLIVDLAAGSVPPGTLVMLALAPPVSSLVPAGSPVSPPVSLTTAGDPSAELGGPVHLRLPMDRRALQEAGLSPWNLELVVQTGASGQFALPSSGLSEEFTLRPGLVPAPGRIPLGPAGLTFEVNQRYDDLLPLDPPFQVGVPLTGFTSDYAEHNLCYFPLEDRLGSNTVADASGSGHPGAASGSVSLGARGFTDRGAWLRGGSIHAEVGKNPSAFALDFHIRPINASDASLIHQAGNFDLRLSSQCAGLPQCRMDLTLWVHDAESDEYHEVATTAHDLPQRLGQGLWNHVVVIYDGHFQARIYVNGAVNSADIANHLVLNHMPFNPASSPGWPRHVASEVSPLVIGGQGIDALVDNVRLSDIARFRVREGGGCPPRCLLGEQAVPGSMAYQNPLLESERPPWDSYWMHDHVTFEYRNPFVQKLTDHSATFAWRRHASDTNGTSIFKDQMDFCFGEAGQEMSRCVPVFSHPVDTNGRSNFPDRGYVVDIEHLRPSTWYHYKVVRRTLRPLADLQDYFGPVRYEVSSDTYFRTAPLALSDQFEFIAFGDFGPTVSTCTSFCSDYYWRGDLITGYDMYHFRYEKSVALHLRAITGEWGWERPSFWLATGDIDQTGYNGHHFEAYLFGAFNKVDRLQGPFNGIMGGMDLKATLGNHNWTYAKDTASEYMNNLIQHPRVFPDDPPVGTRRDLHFKYPSSSYSTDFGNLHLVSLSYASDNNCDFYYYSDDSIRDPSVDRSCFMWEWMSGNPGFSDEARLWSDTDLPPGPGRRRDTDQIAWLKRDLWRYKDDDGIWKVVFFHVPLSGDPDGRSADCPQEDTCGTSDHGNDGARDRLARFFENAGVDLVLTGHEHRFHVMSTASIVEGYSYPGYDFDTDHQEKAAKNIITGTGGYAHWTEDDWPYHVGVPRFFVDGNMMYMVFNDLNDELHNGQIGGPLWDCLMLKGLESAGIYKSVCQPLERFPTSECSEQSSQEGSPCSHDLFGDLTMAAAGRCVRLHTQATDVMGGYESGSGRPGPVTWPGTWGPGLRCIPWPSGEAP